MYVDIVREVVETAISTYADSHGQAEPRVRRNIRKEIDHTATEHYNDEPSINYDDPLCRLGYLYRHAPANATLFEHVLTTSDEVSLKELCADQRVLNVCAVGGGPGTELLGIAKCLLQRPRWMPLKIAFTVLDNVPHWAETWQHLADVIEARFSSSLVDSGVQPPIVAPAFLPLDVLDASSYQNYAFQFRRADIVVCNYLFSENKARLSDAHRAVECLAALTPPGCAFVVIDRRESDPKFQREVVDLFESVFGAEIEVDTYDGTLSPDEDKSDMGETLIQALGYPRTKFFTDHRREPTVFWLVAKRGKVLSG